jgi:hypothetical protein
LACRAAARGEKLDLQRLARELRVAARDIRRTLECLERRGLLCGGLDEGLVPIVPHAGAQFVERGGQVPESVLSFLPRYVDDLYAREALMQAGSALVEEFRFQLLDGDVVAHARRLVPPAFAGAVNQTLALDLFAAAVALMVRLSDERPAGCLAEEIVAVALMEGARRWLGDRCEREELTEKEMCCAAKELRGLFELFEDDDVLALFAQSGPLDSGATSANDASTKKISLVEGRVERWFMPFGWAIPTGYIGE